MPPLAGHSLIESHPLLAMLRFCAGDHLGFFAVQVPPIRRTDKPSAAALTFFTLFDARAKNIVILAGIRQDFTCWFWQALNPLDLLEAKAPGPSLAQSPYVHPENLYSYFPTQEFFAVCAAVKVHVRFHH